MSPTAPQKETHNADNSAAFRYKSFHTKPNRGFFEIPPRNLSNFVASAPPVPSTPR